MKTLWSCTCAATLSLAAVVLPCPAADSAWNGTWKFNEAKSKLTGDTFTITMKADGTYHYSNGSTMEYEFACNGKSYSTLADRTITCTGEPGTGFDFTSMANGTALSKSHRAISADGKTMQIDGTSMQADGTTATYAETYQRVSGSTGMAGKWKNVKDKVSEPGVVEISVSGDVMHLKYPSSKEMIDAKLDGSD